MKLCGRTGFKVFLVDFFAITVPLHREKPSQAAAQPAPPRGELLGSFRKVSLLCQNLSPSGEVASRQR